LPIDRPINSIVSVLPRSDLRSERRCVIDTPGKTLTFQNTNLDFGHVQPTSSLGRVVKLKSIKIRFRLLWGEEIVESSRFVRIKLIHHNPDAVRIRVVNVRKFNHAVNPLARPPLCGDFDGYPPSQRFGSYV
jgi:hypothetical protein